MAKIQRVISEQGSLVYPATITDAVKDIQLSKTQAQINQEVRQGILDLTSSVAGFKFRAVYEGNTYKIQQSVDNGSTWTDLTELIVKNIYIAKYFEEDEDLDSTGLSLGTVVAKTIFDENDTEHENPIYELYCYTQKTNGTTEFVDFGEFTSLTAGVVDELGYRNDVVLSQSAVTSYYGMVEDNPEYIRAYVDADNRFLWGIKTDGSIEWAKGIPTPLKDVIDNLSAATKNAEQAALTNCVGIQFDKRRGVILASYDAHTAAFETGNIDTRTGKITLSFNYFK